jgi:hypothetical protein
MNDVGKFSEESWTAFECGLARGARMGNLFLARDLNAPVELRREAVKMARESQRLFLSLLRKWRSFASDAGVKR